MDVKALWKLSLPLATLLLAACGGGGGSSGVGTEPSTTVQTPGTTNDTQTGAPVISGYSFSLQQGDFWDFGWHMQGSSYAQGSTPSTYDYRGEFRVTLGAPTTIAGVTAFPLIYSGQPHEWTWHFAHDRWTHLAVANNRIYGSSDGQALTELFDAQDGTLLGSGFFRPFSSSNLYAATSNSISNEFIQSTADVLASSSSTGQCEYFPEIGQTICGGDMSTNYSEKEYYQAGIGPVGYYYYLSYSSCGGGFCSGATDQLDIGLVASSLNGDTITQLLELEPNNQLGQANVLSLPSTVRGGFYGEGEYGPTSAYSSVPTVNEVEPNNGVTAGRTPQIITIPSWVIGEDVAGLSAGETYSSPSLQTSPYIEDWYQITPTTSGSYTVDLAFDVGIQAADLDLYIMRASDGALMGLSGGDNPTSGNYTESATFTAAANVPYYIGVDAFAPTISPRVAYTLDTYASGTPISISPTDWYRFSLAAASPVMLSATGGVRLLLLNSASAVVDTAMGSISTGPLASGTYYVGVVQEAASSNNYDLSIQ